MANKKQTETQAENYFNVIVFFFRFAGVPFNMKQISIIYHIYILATVISSCTTFVGMLADVYLHIDDVGHVVTNMRVLISLMDVLFIYFYCR
jgi:hypothetical protein